MFFGTFEHVLDNKNRLVIPGRIVKSLKSDKLFIMKGYEGTLSIFPNEEFDKYLAKLQSFPYENKSSRDVLRIALSSVYELELDKSNRVQIPTSLVNKYKISKEVVVVGVLDHIEVWSKDKWEKYLEDNEKDFEDVSERLNKNV